MTHPRGTRFGAEVLHDSLGEMHDNCPEQGDVQARSGSYTVAVALVAAVGGLMFGYDIGVISFAKEGVKNAFKLGTFEIEVVVAAVLAGSFAGAIVRRQAVRSNRSPVDQCLGRNPFRRWMPWVFSPVLRLLDDHCLSHHDGVGRGVFLGGRPLVHR